MYIICHVGKGMTSSVLPESLSPVVRLPPLAQLEDLHPLLLKVLSASKQIRELQAKIVSGEINKPDQNQLDKIAKQDEVEEELEKLTGGK